MQEAGADGVRIQIEVHQNAGDVAAVRKVGLSAFALLVLVRFLGEVIGFFNQGGVLIGVIFLEFAQQGLQIGGVCHRLYSCVRSRKISAAARLATPGSPKEARSFNSSPRIASSLAGFWNMAIVSAARERGVASY